MNAFPSLMAPIKLGNTVVKSRMMFPNALPHFQQGPENYPADPLVTFYSDIAKNGAGIVLVHWLANKDQRQSPNLDGKHFPMWDPEDPAVQNYICQLNDTISYYGGLPMTDLFYEMGRSLMVSELAPEEDTFKSMTDYLKMLSGEDDLDVEDVPEVFGLGEKHAATREDIENYIKEGCENAIFLKNMGFKAGHIELARYSLLGSFLSPTKNSRTDEFGGSLENRMRFPLMALKAIREAVGPDFLLVGECTYQDEFGAPPLDECIEFMKAADEYLDLLHIRYGMGGTGFECTYEQAQNPIVLDYCANLKKAGVKTPICAATGLMKPSQLDAAIASGAIDMVSAGRIFITNPDLGKLIKEGRDEDVVPCLRCNRCHGISLTGDFVSVCGVNPQLGLYARIHRMVTEPEGVKNCAVIGGGPAGMYAAKILAQRGHKVTLYEASDALGGQLKLSRYPDFKWPLRNFLDYLIGQMDRLNVEVKLNTKADPETIKAGGYDAVFACTGAVPKKPAIEGAENTDWNTMNIYGREAELGENVVCIGGSESSAEGALYLARAGHKVTILSRQDKIAHDANPVHWQDKVEEVVTSHENVTAIRSAKTTKIEKGAVTYVDKDGAEHVIKCDDIVAAGGMQPLQEEAMAFYGSAPEFYMIGDGKKVGDVRICLREAFAAASQV